MFNGEGSIVVVINKEIPLVPKNRILKLFAMTVITRDKKEIPLVPKIKDFVTIRKDRRPGGQKAKERVALCATLSFAPIAHVSLVFPKESRSRIFGTGRRGISFYIHLVLHKGSPKQQEESPSMEDSS